MGDAKRLAYVLGILRENWRTIYEAHYSTELPPEVRAALRAVDGALEVAVRGCGGASGAGGRR